MMEHEVRLPTEAEWERAARHTDGRNYPWGEKFSADRCNMNETGIRRASAVGLFPSGNALCGAGDMSGNIWEWCSTPWIGSYENYETEIREDLEGDARRVLRGGSFTSYDYFVRCAFRDHHYSHSQLNNFGLRVLLPGSGFLISENSEL